MWVMVPSEDIEFEGDTSFGDTAYRYAVAFKNAKLSIYLEEDVSKKEWYTGGLDEAECITPGNEISGALAADYAEIFGDALKSDVKDSGDVKRKLEVGEDGALKLELVVCYHVLHSSWKAKYDFTLHPVSRERIDALESTLQTCQKRIEALELQNQPANAPATGISGPSCVLLKATDKLAKDSILCWTIEESDQRIVSVECGVVTVVRSGMYIVGAIVRCRDAMQDEEIMGELERNGECIGYVDGIEYCGNVTTAIHLEEGDKLTTTCAIDVAGTSTLSIAYLGN